MNCTTSNKRSSFIDLLPLWLRLCHGGLWRAKCAESGQDPHRIVLLVWPLQLLWLLHLIHYQGLRAPNMLCEMGSAAFQPSELLLNVQSTNLVHPETSLGLRTVPELSLIHI